MFQLKKLIRKGRMFNPSIILWMAWGLTVSLFLFLSYWFHQLSWEIWKSPVLLAINWFYLEWFRKARWSYLLIRYTWIGLMTITLIGIVVMGITSLFFGIDYLQSKGTREFIYMEKMFSFASLLGLVMFVEWGVLFLLNTRDNLFQNPSLITQCYQVITERFKRWGRFFKQSI